MLSEEERQRRRRAQLREQRRRAAKKRRRRALLARTLFITIIADFVVGLEGEIVQCIPCNEIAYASNDRNSDTISIECCHPDATGKFNQETKDTLIHLTAWLTGRYGRTTDNADSPLRCDRQKMPALLCGT